MTSKGEFAVMFFAAVGAGVCWCLGWFLIFMAYDFLAHKLKTHKSH